MMTSFFYSQAKMSPVCKIEHCFVTAVTGSYITLNACKVMMKGVSLSKARLEKEYLHYLM